MKFFNFFLLLWVIFALLDPDPDPDPLTRLKPGPIGIRIRIRNPAPHSSLHSLLTTSFSISLPASPHPSICPSLYFSLLNYSFVHHPSTSISFLFPLFTPHSMLFRPRPLPILSHLLLAVAYQWAGWMATSRFPWISCSAWSSATAPSSSAPQSLSSSVPQFLTPTPLHYAMIWNIIMVRVHLCINLLTEMIKIRQSSCHSARQSQPSVFIPLPTCVLLTAHLKWNSFTKINVIENTATRIKKWSSVR